MVSPSMLSCMFFFFFNDTATTEIYTLSLHDALPICSRQIIRSPRVLLTHLPAYACRIYVTAFRARTGLCVSWPAYPAVPPLSASCSSGQRFAYSFLQIPSRDGHPCRSANTSPCRVCRGLSPPSECALPGAPSRTLPRWRQREVLQRREPEPSKVFCPPHELQPLSPRSLTQMEQTQQTQARNRMLAMAVAQLSTRSRLPPPPCPNSPLWLVPSLYRASAV